VPSPWAFGTSIALHLLVVSMLLLPEKLLRGMRFYTEPTSGRPNFAQARKIQPPDESKLPPAGTGFGGQYDGVILWPKEDKKTTTLVPPMPAVRPNLFAKSDQQPFVIPFYGFYWIFKPPDFRPPPNSLTAHGRPVELTFRSTDFRPLIMEARQNLSRRIELGCCGRIEVAVLNGDIVADSLEMEVRLTDVTAKGSPSLSLGRMPITSIAGDGAPSRENVGFKIPPAAPITHFDEIVVEFHLQPIRASRSPKIAIERFLFYPRR